MVKNITIFIVALFTVLAIGCTQHNPEIGNQVMRLPAAASEGTEGSVYIQAFIVVAPEASLETNSKQDQKTTPDVNLGLNGGAATGSGDATGAMSIIQETVSNVADKVKGMTEPVVVEEEEPVVLEEKPVVEGAEPEVAADPKPE